MTDLEVGQILRQCRERKNISQAEMARFIKKNQPIVSRIEKGEATIDAVSLIKWGSLTDSSELIATMLIGSVPVKRAALIVAFYFQLKSNVEILEKTI